MDSKNILIVEDDTEIREGVRILLGSEGYNIIEADSGEEALKEMSDAIDLVLLDIMLPGISGLKVCEEMRKISNIPIIFLSAKAQEADKSIALMAGGDDYLVKPFSFAELTTRVNAQLRRYLIYQGKNQDTTKVDEHFLTSGRLRIALGRNEVWKDGAPLELREMEYKVLSLLMRYPNKIFSAQMIYESVWEKPYEYSSNGTIMVHIQKLRSKIEDNPQTPVYIKNIWGKGYRFEKEELHI